MHCYVELYTARDGNLIVYDGVRRPLENSQMHKFFNAVAALNKCRDTYCAVKLLGVLFVFLLWLCNYMCSLHFRFLLKYVIVEHNRLINIQLRVYRLKYDCRCARRCC